MVPRKAIGCRVRGDAVHWRCMTTEETFLTVLFLFEDESGDLECERCGDLLKNDESPTRR